MKSIVWPVSGLLFCSGLCALVFQVAWLREFRLVFGASTPAAAAVLAIFMGGLGLGNAILGRRADAAPSPLRMYGMLELLISLASMASPFLIDLSRAVYVWLGGQQSLGLFGATIVRLLLAALVLGLPTFLMGGTLPAAARTVALAHDDGRRSIGLLYGLNTLGAVLGAVLSTFVLLEALGTRNTLFSACSLNLATGLTAILLAGRLSLGGATPSAGEPVPIPEARPERKGRSPRTPPREEAADAAAPSAPRPADASADLLLYLAACLVGFAFFLMELVWYRMLTPILGGTTFTFGLILAVALAGIGIGGAIYPRLFGHRRPTLSDLALSCALEALAVAIPFALGDRLAVLAVVLLDLSWFGFPGQVLAWTVVTSIIIFPAAVVSGVQFPLIIALLGEGERNVGKQVGYAFAWNTVGAVGGSLAGGFGLLPLLSAIGVWNVVVVVLAALGGVVAMAAFQQSPRIGRLGASLAAALAAIGCLIAMGPTAVWRHSGIGVRRAAPPTTATPNALQDWQHKLRRISVWEADGRESSVAIVAADGISFYVNGKSDGNARQDANTQVMLGMLGAILHANPKSAAVVGLGSGESAGWLAATPGMERVDVIELEPAMDEVARRCAPLNHNVLALPNVRRIYNDAREVLLTTHDRYDLIVSEPSNPYRAGIASLYTREFYEAVSARLNDGGLFVQWLQAYEVDGRTIRTVFGTLHDAFEHVEVWRSAGTDMLLVCSKQPLYHDVARLRQRVAQSHIREAIKLAWYTDSLEGVMGFFVARSDAVEEVARRERLRNTDDHNVLEYGFARNVGHAAGVGIERVLAEAAARGWARPQLVGGDIDWDRADAERRAYLLIANEHQFLAQNPPATEGARKRAEPIEMLIQGDTAGAAARWKEAPLSELSEVEKLLFAVASVDSRGDKAAELIEHVRKFHALNADALHALSLYRQGKANESASALHKVLVALRDDATAHPFVIRPCLAMVPPLVTAQPQAASLLLDGFQKPFALMAFEEQRLGIVAQLASYLPPQAAVGAIAMLEPNVPWKIEYLDLRARIYRQAGDQRAAIAEADMAEFLSREPDPVVLPPPR